MYGSLYRRTIYGPGRDALYPSITGSITPNPSTKSHSAGIGMPTGRWRRSSRTAMRAGRAAQPVGVAALQ